MSKNLPQPDQSCYVRRSLALLAALTLSASGCGGGSSSGGNGPTPPQASVTPTVAPSGTAGAVQGATLPSGVEVTGGAVVGETVPPPDRHGGVGGRHGNIGAPRLFPRQSGIHAHRPWLKPNLFLPPSRTPTRAPTPPA